MSLSADALSRALAALAAGECIGLPTETVYGLAADAENPEAIRKVFARKGRPADHPLILHLGAVGWMERYARDIPAQAFDLAERFWPGPLTLVLERGAAVPLEATGGQDTVALRMPDHALALEVLRRFGRALVAPSANRFGGLSPTRAEHVREAFPDLIVLDGGPCRHGIESTILDLSREPPLILRPGAIPRHALETVIGKLPIAAEVPRPRVPGGLPRHYAPETPIRLLPREALSSTTGGSLVLAIGTLPEGLSGIALPNDPSAYAQRLYAALRELDRAGAASILVELPPNEPAWEAIQDRLRRAAATPDRAS
ncbi:MAG: threonylcarbamoyl-AMP synthase [Lysobacterales bacterium]|jgi:L-threonylcarbamoyladenylate synthase|nr:MAG: threonylcarbamoyl-AMP synthase [Xanthomonadales bacterium]